MADALVVKLGMDKRGFSADAENAQKDMARLKEAIATTSVELAKYHREAREAGGATAQQAAQIKTLDAAIKSYGKELRSAAADYTAFKKAAAASDTSGAPMPFARSRVEEIRKARAEEEAELRKPIQNGTDSSPAAPAHGTGEHGRTAMLAHSARSMMDMMGAGADPLMALKVEGPRLVQAFGGGLGAIIGVGAGLAGLGLLVEKTVEETEKAKELKRAFDAALRADPSQGVQSIEMLTAHIKQLQTLLDETAPKGKSVWSRFMQNAGDNLADLGQLITNPHHAHSGQTTESRDKKVSDAEAKRGADLQQVVQREKEINDLRERGFQQGEKQVRAAEIELELAKKKADIEAGLGIPELRNKLHERGHSKEERERWQKELDQRQQTANGQTSEAVRASGLDQIKADLEANAETRGIASRQHAAEIEAPDVADVSNPEKVPVFDTDLHGKAIDQAKGQLDDAQKALDDVRNHNADDREAVTVLKEKAAEWEKVVRHARDELTAVKATTLEMQAQAKGLASQAKIGATATSYDARIKKARDEGDTEQVEELEKQKHLAVRSSEADFQGTTPAALAREKRAAQRREQLANAYESNQRRHEETVKANGHSLTFEELMAGGGQTATRRTTASKKQADDHFMHPINARIPTARELAAGAAGLGAGGSNSNNQIANHLAKIERATETMAKNLDLGPGSKWFMSY